MNRFAPSHLRHHRLTAAAAALAAALSGPTAARAAPPPPQAGIDCGCSATGDFRPPRTSVAAVPPDASGSSPSGRFLVTAAPGPGLYATLTVRDVITQVNVLANLVAADWGFSPGDLQLVMLPPPSGSANQLDIYDLLANPGHKVASIPLSPLGGSLAFSQSGKYAVDFEITPNQTSFSVRVLAASTMGVIHANAFSLGTLVAQGATVSMGFSPGDERTFTYWFLNASNQDELHVVNLVTGLQQTLIFGVGLNSFTQSFSRCGDVLALWEGYADFANPPASRWDVARYGTNSLAPQGTWSILQLANPGFSGALVTTATDQVAVLSDRSQVVLGPNHAGELCPGDAAPQAAFGLPALPLVGVPLTFVDASTVGFGGTLKEWQWDFGDGSHLTTAPPDPNGVHTYAAAGTYTVTLTAVDTRNLTSTVSHDVTVAANRAPVASFLASPDAPVGRDHVTLTDASSDDDGITFRQWVVNGQSSSGPTVTLVACPGTIDVSLTVYDHAGQSATATRTIAVASAASHDVPVPAGGDLAAFVATSGGCPDDRLVLEPGRYAGGVSLGALSIVGAGAGSTTIDGSGLAWDYALRLEVPAGATATVASLTVDGGPGGVRVGGGGDVVLDHVEVAHATVGGGVWAFRLMGTLSVLASHLHHNRLDSNFTEYDYHGGPGGGLGAYESGAIVVDGSELAFNTSASGEGAGVGLAQTTSLTVTRSDVHDNAAFTRGGGLSAVGATQVEVRTSRIVDNQAAVGGGAVVLDGAALLAGCLVARNAGGGVLDLGTPSRLSVLDDTIADNSGFGLQTAAANGATVANTILAGNTVDLEGTPATSVANLVGGSPVFAGDTDYHLAAGSPAIDAGDNASVPPQLTVDFEGDARIVAVEGAAAVVDIGWDEARPGVAPPPPPSTPHGGCGQGGAGGLASLGLLLALMAARRARRRSPGSRRSPARYGV